MDLSQLASRVAQSMEEQIEQAGKLVSNRLRAGGKVLACGRCVYSHPFTRPAARSGVAHCRAPRNVQLRGTSGGWPRGHCG